MGGVCATETDDDYHAAPKQVNERIYKHPYGCKYGYGESPTTHSKEVDEMYFSGEFQDQANYLEWNVITSDNTVKTARLWVVFDGHGSWEVGTYCASHFPEFFSKYIRDLSELDMITSTIEHVFERFDKKILETGYPGGCTCAALFIADGYMWSIHLGDCKVLVFQQNEIIFQTEDHKRTPENYGRLSPRASQNGASEILRLTHLFGDWGLTTNDKNKTSLKSHFSCSPNVVRMDLNEYPVEAPFYIMLASHGLFTALLPKQIPAYVIPSEDLTKCCREIINIAREEKATEDISMFIVNAWKFIEDDPFGTFVNL